MTPAADRHPGTPPSTPPSIAWVVVSVLVVVATALLTTAFQWAADVGSPALEGSAWTCFVLGLVVLGAAGDRWVRTWTGPGLVTGGVILASAAHLLREGSASLDDAGLLIAVVPPVVVLTAGTTAAGLGLGLLDRRRRRWALVVVALAALAWSGCLGWWALDAQEPQHPERWVAGFAVVAAASAVLGDLVVAPWLGGLLVLVTPAVLAFGPLAAADPLGVVAWVFLAACAAVVAAAVSGTVTLVRLVVRAVGRRTRGTAGRVRARV